MISLSVCPLHAPSHLTSRGGGGPNVFNFSRSSQLSLVRRKGTSCYRGEARALGLSKKYSVKNKTHSLWSFPWRRHSAASSWVDSPCRALWA